MGVELLKMLLVFLVSFILAFLAIMTFQQIQLLAPELKWTLLKQICFSFSIGVALLVFALLILIVVHL
jgi:hypothetical protein